MKRPAGTARVLDHDRFPFRTTAEAIVPKSNSSLIVNLVLVLQRFPIEAKTPFALPGALDRPYPDLGNATQRESGLGHALWRLTDKIEAQGLPASFVVERQALPWLRDIDVLLRDPRHCIVAGGEHAVRVHTAGMAHGEEHEIISTCLRDIEASLERKVQGWRSPYCSQSPATLDILAEAGLRYVGDFANDDRPFEIRTDSTPLVAVPMNHFYSDLHFIHGCRQSVDEYARATISAAERLAVEGWPTPAVLSLVVHPWIMGASHRVDCFSSMLAALRAMPGVSFMNSDDIYASSMNGTNSANAARCEQEG